MVATSSLGLLRLLACAGGGTGGEGPSDTTRCARPKSTSKYLKYTNNNRYKLLYVFELINTSNHDKALRQKLCKLFLVIIVFYV